MALEDLYQYALGAESRADLYVESEDLRAKELAKLRSRCVNILKAQAKIEVNEIPDWVKILCYPLKKGKDSKQLYKQVTLNMPLKEGGQYQAEVKLSNGFRWVKSDTRPELLSDDNFYIEYSPKGSEKTEDMSSINIALKQDGGYIDTMMISDGEMDMGDYTMINKILDEFERWGR